MIYLVGIKNHNLQHDGMNRADLTLRNSFGTFLERKARELDVTLLAEEFNEDALFNISKGQIATLQSIAKKLKIDHRFCEASIEERRQRGILSSGEILSKKLNIKIERDLNANEQKIFDEEQKKSFDMREKIWLERMVPIFSENIIFVCGAQHINTFSSLLKREKHEIKILTQSWPDN